MAQVLGLLNVGLLKGLAYNGSDREELWQFRAWPWRWLGASALRALNFCIRHPTTLLESTHEEALRTEWRKGSRGVQTSNHSIRHGSPVFLDLQPSPATSCLWLRNPSLYHMEQGRWLAKPFPNSQSTKSQDRREKRFFLVVVAVVA